MKGTYLLINHNFAPKEGDQTLQAQRGGILMYNTLLEFSSLASIDSFDSAHNLGRCENSESKTLFNPNF
jgi:hypothetical protein